MLKPGLKTRPTHGWSDYTWLVRPGCLLFVVLAFGGCQRPAPPSSEAPGPVTFAKHVAPILFRHCVPCHRAGESAPFGLTTYAEVRQRARTIATAVGRGLMPPWLPAAGHGEFAGERRLAASEIDLIERWVQQGAAEGDPSLLPELPAFTDGWRLGTPDLILSLPKPYTVRETNRETWRNLVMPIPVPSTRFVRTIEVRPGSGVVHHALAGVDATRSSRRRDERDPEPGFEGMDMGDALSPDGHLLGWTPGMLPFPGIKDQAWRLEPGTDLVLQLHITPSGKAEELNPMVGLYFTGPPPAPAPLQLIRLDADDAIDIPPGEKNFVVSDAFELPVDLEVLAVYPHAHLLATTMDATATLPGGAKQLLIRIDAWDFKWQDIYRYKTPLSLPRGSTITMRYTYDNSSDNVRNPTRPPRRVVAGLQSSDEMAHLQLQVRPRTVDDGLLMKEALYRHTLGKNPGNAWAWYELGNALRDRGRPLEAIEQYRAALERDARHAPTHNNLGAVLADQARVDEAMLHYREALRLEPDFADAHYNLGNALRAANRLKEATAHYREALRLEPTHAEAHNNLGEALSAQGSFEEAVRHFQEAARLKPDSAEAENNLGAVLGALGRYREAIAHFQRALAIDPGHARARENLAIALERTKSQL